MKTSEFCAVMAVNVEEAECVHDNYGLCGFLGVAMAKGLITRRQRRVIMGTMWDMFNPAGDAAYIWPAGAWKPRVVALQLLAEHFAEKGQ